ncbi:MAG: thiol:disulfide interchange protein precursor [ANME-2 cluster archaeon HR1]|nr:MAG: thiol:disulfide interchange protein precursor [ANME-2 cluster archaeon HR1]
MIYRAVHLLNVIRINRQLFLVAVLFILFFQLIPVVSASDDQMMEYFYEYGCSNCAQVVPVIDEVVGQYGNITLEKYEISTDYNGTTGYARMKVYGAYSVPAVVINRQITILYSDYNGNKSLLRELLISGIENAPRMIQNNSNQTIQDTDPLPELSFFMVLIAGFLAGFNPCLIAVMTFLATITLSSQGGRKDMLIMVIGFCTGIFIVFMLGGLFLLGVVRQHPRITDSITLFLVLLIGIMGLWHLYDAYHLSKHDRSSFKTPDSFKRLMSAIEGNAMEGKNILIVSCIAGGVFSLVKAPCVGAVYFAIIDLIISQGNIAKGGVYLALYNFGVVFPVLVLGVLLAYGMNPEKVTEFREKRRVEVRIITGIVLIALALLIYFKVI